MPKFLKTLCLYASSLACVLILCGLFAFHSYRGYVWWRIDSAFTKMSTEEKIDAINPMAPLEQAAGYESTLAVAIAGLEDQSEDVRNLALERTEMILNRLRAAADKGRPVGVRPKDGAALEHLIAQKLQDPQNPDYPFYLAYAWVIIAEGTATEALFIERMHNAGDDRKKLSEAWIALQLMGQNPPVLVDSVREHLQPHTAPELMIAAIVMAGTLAEDSLLAPLLAIADNPELPQRIRAGALWSLRGYGARAQAALPTLTTLAQDPDWENERVVLSPVIASIRKNTPGDSALYGIGQVFSKKRPPLW